MKHTQLRTLRAFAALILVGGLFIIGCGDDSGTDPTVDAPKGFVLKVGGVEKVTQTGTGVNGTIAIDRGRGQGGHGVPSEEMELILTKSDGSVFTLAAGDTLEVEPGSTDFLGVQRIAGDQLHFYLLGKGASNTTVSFRLLRGVNQIFSSGPIQVMVTTDGLEVTKLRAVGLSNAIVTVNDTIVTGQLTASSLSSDRIITVDLFNAKDDPIIYYNNPAIQVTAEITDTTLATVTRDPADPSSFNIVGRAGGKTKIVFTVMHVGDPDGDYLVFKTPEIDLDVQ